MTDRHTLRQAELPAASQLAEVADPRPWFLMPALSQDGTWVSGFLVSAAREGTEWVVVTLSPNRENTERWAARLRATAPVKISRMVTETV